MRPTPSEVTTRRCDYLLALDDNGLCTDDYRTAAIPARWPCGRNEINDSGDVTTCSDPGEWARKPRKTGKPACRGCTRHVAAEIRAELWLLRRSHQSTEDPSCETPTQLSPRTTPTTRSSRRGRRNDAGAEASLSPPSPLW